MLQMNITNYKYKLQKYNIKYNNEIEAMVIEFTVKCAYGFIYYYRYIVLQ